MSTAKPKEPATATSIDKTKTNGKNSKTSAPQKGRKGQQAAVQIELKNQGGATKKKEEPKKAQLPPRTPFQIFVDTLLPEKELQQKKIEYLKRFEQTLPVDINEVLDEVKEHVVSLTLTDKSEMVLKPSQIPEQLSSGTTHDIEEQIRRSKLQEITKMKDELQRKLLSLDENICLLGTEADMKVKKDKAYYMLSKEEKRKVKEEAIRKQEEALEFVKQKQAERKERKKKMRELRRQEFQRVQREIEENQQAEEIKKREQLAARKQEMKHSFEVLRHKREEEIKRQHDHSFIAPSHYLYQDIEERYKKTVLTPMLEHQKQVLAEKRNIAKHLTKEDIEKHKRWCEEIEAKQEEKRATEQKVKKQQEEEIARKQGDYRSKLSHQVLLKESLAREEQEKERQKRREAKERIDNYMQVLKETHPVTASDKKAAELKELIQHLKHPVKEKRDVRKLYEPSIVCKRGEVRSVSSEREAGIKPCNRSIEVNRRNFKKNHLQTPTCELRMQKNQSKEDNRSRKIDYLSEIRSKHYKASKPLNFDWAKELNNSNLDPITKRERIEMKAKMIEEKAREKEKLYNAQGGAEKNMELGENVTDMFVDAIRAKLAILEGVQSDQITIDYCQRN